MCKGAIQIIRPQVNCVMNICTVVVTMIDHAKETYM